MKMQMIIKHVSTSIQFSGDEVDADEEDVEQAKTFIKENLPNLNYLEVGGTILPGDFVRNQCVIKFLIV